MGMAVREQLVCVSVRVPLHAGPRKCVGVPVMLVVHLRMIVHLRRMDVPVLVLLGHVQPHPAPISAPAIQNYSLGRSPDTTIAIAPPKKGWSTEQDTPRRLAAQQFDASSITRYLSPVSGYRLPAFPRRCPVQALYRYLEETMDTVFLSVPALNARLGTRHWPLVVDVRQPLAFDADSRMVAGALRCAPDAFAEFAGQASPGTEIVCYGAHGRDISRGAAERVRELGYAARVLDGGIEAWREAGAPLIKKNPALGVPSEGPSRWVTRERPKIDRIACPWLIRRFIDPRAEFYYVPTPDVFAVAEARGAVAFDIPGGAIEHDAEFCSFDTLLRAFGLIEPALHQLAVIVRGADTGKPELTPQSPGLLAVSLGLSRNYPDDLEMLSEGMVLYDALYAWCRHAQAETHGWHPETMR